MPSRLVMTMALAAADRAADCRRSCCSGSLLAVGDIAGDSEHTQFAANLDHVGGDDHVAGLAGLPANGQVEVVGHEAVLAEMPA